MCALSHPKHITKSSALCISYSPFNSSQNDYFSSKRLSLYGAYQQINLSTSSSKTNITAITLSLTPLISTSYSHSSSFTTTIAPPTPSDFPDHHSTYPLTPIPSILEPCPLNLTSCKQHTSIILFFSSSQTSPTIPLRLPTFHVSTYTPKRPSCLPSYCKPCLHAPR